MRKLPAVILLLVFFTSQYEKQLGYANCRIANYLKTDGKKCDCEKILQDNGNPVSDSEAPLAHTHHHPDESYFPPVNKKEPIFLHQHTSFSIIHSDNLPEGCLSGIEHPPQTG